uniref:Uncharacterized protein n=1 Tax=Xiphophorus couchianus TaxID=32473 RepID=A0A3B5LH99_9TELE
MSRSDYPPGYDNSHGPMYPPQGGGYPPPPSYGFPSYGGPQPGQPFAPYPSGPNAPLFPGQPTGYPAAPYPGQPQPAGPPGSGYPAPPPMPPVMPPTIPSGVLSSGKGPFILLSSRTCKAFDFFEIVHILSTTQSSNIVETVAVYFITHIVLVCCKGPRRKFPWNVILLLIFVILIQFLSGCSYYNTKAVFLALGITAVVCIAVTVFCFQTKVDFTKCQGLFCVLGIVMFVTGIITAIVLSFKYIYWLHMLYAAIGAIVFTLFLAYHTQLLIGNRKYSISPEEYVFAALSLYVDIVQIFLFLLQIIGSFTK